MASPNISEILTTTIENRSGVLADGVSDNNALLSRLKERGRVKPFSGGVEIRQELSYQDSTAQWYSGYDQIDTSPTDSITSANYAIKQAVAAVSISGLEELQNSGKEQIIDLLEARVEIAEKSLMNLVAAGVYAAGTGNGGKEFGGLQYLVAGTPTSGTVGGIDRSTNTWWRNMTRDSSNASVTASATTVQSEFNIMYANQVRGRDVPDMIIVDTTWWNYFLGSLQTIQRITNEKLGQLGFVNVKYINADVVLDGGAGGNCPANTAYFLNTDYIFYRPHSKRNMVAIGGDRMNTNQDAIVKLIGVAGNMTMSNAFLQGILTV